MLFLDSIKSKIKTRYKQTSKTKEPGPAQNGKEKAQSGPIQ